VAAGACNDSTPHFFPNVAAGTILSWAVTGPAGQFSATVKLKKDADPPQSKPDSGSETLAVGVYSLAITVLFVTTCEVQVEASCGAHKFCRKILGAAGTTDAVALSVVAA